MAKRAADKAKSGGNGKGELGFEAKLAEAFTDTVRPAVERIIAGVHESRALAALRDSLLPKLISGELRVRDAERPLEAATI